jgi:cytochrome P450
MMKASHRLKDEAQLLFATGMQTAGWTLTLATFHLLENPSILSKLKTELKTVDPDSCAQRSIPVLKRPYFMAIVVEALRFSIRATHRLQRIFQHPLTFEPSEESQRSWTIPSGTPTSVSVWHLHQIRMSFQTHGPSSQSAGSKPLIR